MGVSEYREAQANLKALENTEKSLKISNYQRGVRKAAFYKDILKDIRNLKDLEIRRTGDFMRLKERLQTYGSLDYKYMKATIFRENFELALEESSYKNLSNFNILKSKLDTIKNPLKFFEFVSKSEVFSDLFIYYKPR